MTSFTSFTQVFQKIRPKKEKKFGPKFKRRPGVLFPVMYGPIYLDINSHSRKEKVENESK